MAQHTYLVENESELDANAIRSLLKQSCNRIEAILTLNGITTMAVLGILRQLGIRVGIDIALISFDDF